MTGLEMPAGRSVVWPSGLRERWAGEADRVPGPTDWSGAARDFPKARVHQQVRLLAWGPEELFRPLLATWRPEEYPTGLRPVVARFGEDARDAAVHAGAIEGLVPFLDAEVARMMAARFFMVSKTEFGDPAREWCALHGAAAVPYLVPDALGAAVGPHRQAMLLLRVVVDGGKTDRGCGTDAAVAAARDPHGDRAADALGALLETDPAGPPNGVTLLEGCKRPAFPAWATPEGLPRLLLRDGHCALPHAATKTFLLLLSNAAEHTGFAAIGPDVDLVVGRLDSRSVAEFGWAVFEEWHKAGMKGSHAWVLDALGRVGDDDTVRRLTPLIGKWPGSGRQSRAAQGLRVLFEMGDEATDHVHHLEACRSFPCGDMAWLRFEPGIYLNDLDRNPEQTITRVHLTRKAASESFDDVAVSEFLTDLAGLASLTDP